MSSHEWEVELTVTGPITVERPLRVPVEKGAPQSFWTTASIKRAPSGVNVEVVVHARHQDEANDAAVYFVGQTLDVLSLHLDLPVYLSLSGTQYRPLEPQAKRVVTRHEWIDAFKLGRDYGIHRPVFSRALSWHRKGLTSEDPIDKLIAWWSSIEAVGSKLARKTPKTRKGAINQVCDCFDQLWDNVGQWRVIPNNAALVDRFHELRNGIAHGFMAVDIENVREVAGFLPTLRELAHTFLTDWADGGASPEPQDAQ